MKKISNWIYKKIFLKKYLEWKKEGYDQGHAHGMSDFKDAKYWHIEYIKSQENQQLPETWFVDYKKVLSIGSTGLISIAGQQASDQEILNLKSEIRSIKNMEFYKILNNTLRQKAIEKSLLTATDLYSLKGNEQVLAGKMMIYNLDIINTLINKIDKYKIKL